MISDFEKLNARSNWARLMLRPTDADILAMRYAAHSDKTTDADAKSSISIPYLPTTSLREERNESVMTSMYSGRRMSHHTWRTMHTTAARRYR